MIAAPDPLVDELRVERHRQRRTQRSVADAIGVSQAEVSRWEAGLKSPTLASLRRWADALDLDLAPVRRVARDIEAVSA